MKLFVAAVLVLLADAYYPEWEIAIEEHNVYRCMHGVKWLQWSEELAKQAKDWTYHENGDWRNFNHGGSHMGSRIVGQNMAGGSALIDQATGYFDGRKFVGFWYDEIKYTYNGRVSSFGGNTGHYTQLVWRATTHVGCGQYKELVVCDYYPAGNYGGEFEENVNSPVKSESSCRAEVAQTTTRYWDYAYYSASHKSRRRRLPMLLAETNASVTNASVIKEDSEDSFDIQEAQDTESLDAVSLASSSNEAHEPSSTRLSRGLGASWVLAAAAATTGVVAAAWKGLKRKQDASYQLMQS